MKKSCGIIIIYSNKMLLCRPSNGANGSFYGVPKGKIEVGESDIECALRELREETGIIIKDPSDKAMLIIDYNDKNGETYKQLYLFVHRINNLSEIGLIDEIVPFSQLQHEEVNWCGFMSKEEALSKIFHKQKSILNLLL